MAVRDRGADRRDQDDPDDGRMTLVEHLTELRTRLFKSVVAIAVGAVVGFVLYDRILELLISPYCDVLAARDPERECRLVILAPLDGFSVRVKLAGYTGLTLALPVVLWQLWRFITPGLYPNEKRYAVPFVASAFALFLLGSATAFWSVPRALQFLIGIGGEQLEPLFNPVEYLSFIVLMALAFGLGFQFPILLLFLQLVGVLSHEQLGEWRRYAIVLIFILVAIITPTGDPFTLLALAVPMCLFYEGSILAGRLIRRRRARATDG
jgi:sec-independent protein translocase protein TatC